MNEMSGKLKLYLGVHYESEALFTIFVNGLSAGLTVGFDRG